MRASSPCTAGSGSGWRRHRTGLDRAFVPETLNSRNANRMSCSPSKSFFISPRFHRERSSGRLRLIDHGAGAAPPKFFVEPGRPLVTDRTREPSRRDSPADHPGFGVCKQPRRCTGTACVGGHEELIEFVVSINAEAGRRARWPDHPDVRQCRAKPFPEALEGSKLLQFLWEQRGVRVLPSVVPNLRQLFDICVFCCSHVHGSTLSAANGATQTVLFVFDPALARVYKSADSRVG